MLRSFIACYLAVASLCWLASAQGPRTGTHVVRLNGHDFTLPTGFDIELVAGPPLVDRPITADFDEQGRLYVGDSSGSNEKVEVQLEKKPHRIIRLEDTNGDGKFDKSVVFADKMMFPEGTMWYAGSLYVAAPPSIWKLTDTNGDGVADQRVEWFQGKTLTGCANDLHGPYLGPDGWIYWCKGAFAKQTYDLPPLSPPGGEGSGVRGSDFAATTPSPRHSPPVGERGKRRTFTTRAAHIFRARPDGTGIEPVMTGGMDNPVDVVFMPNGERIFTTTFLQHPGGGKRDGLIHAIYGGIYGKDHDPIHEHPWTGPSLMPVLSHLGPAAPAGLCRYESAVFGKEYQDNLFAALFNVHKVSRHVLTPKGASYESRDEDFVVSSNLDFHPTDVMEDADGSLLILDTGGWYKLCCPTSQLVKPDVLGAIYRVRRKGAAKAEDSRGTKLPWKELGVARLAQLLDDPRPAVRSRAMEALAAKGNKGLLPLIPFFRTGSGKSAEAKRNALWVAIRRGNTPPATPEHVCAATIVTWGLHDQDESVRHVALQGVSLWRGPNSLKLQRMLRDDVLPNQRGAAEALGRIGDPKAVPALLDALGATDVDHVLEHSLIYALIEIGNAEATSRGLTHPHPAVRRGALIALDQMSDGKLAAEAVTMELAAESPALQEAAWWIAGRHPEWGDALTGVLQQRLMANLPSAAQDELARQLARLAKSPALQKLLAETVSDGKANRLARRTCLRAMAQAGLRDTPESWLVSLSQASAENEAELVGDAVATLRSLRLAKPQQAKQAAVLLLVAGRTELPLNTRLSALAALPGGAPRIEPGLFDLLLAQLQPDQAVGQRALAADVLGKARLSTEQLGALARAVQKTGPLELDRLLEAFAACSDDAVGEKLIAALKAAPARSSVRIDALKQRLAKFGPNVQKHAAELYTLLETDTALQRVKLEELLARLKDGDIRRGQAVFHSQKAACFACHAIGYRGGNIGPDLSRIGAIRTERDLLEAIVFPNASMVRSYEPVVVATKDGRIFNGVLRKDAPDEIILALDAEREVRLARDDVEAIQDSKVSIMPAGLDQQLTPQELADLVAFLKACK
jgi:putative membrane-bound dehydrogenase-like protein